MLDVLMYEEFIGQLAEKDGRLEFKYNQRAMDLGDKYALSVKLPIRTESYDDRWVTPFFDNLLPEGDARNIVAQAQQYDRSDVQALLGSIGGECAGAVSLWPSDERPASPPVYRDCGAADLERFFSGDNELDLVETQLESRQSMSGAQDKLALRRDGIQYRLPLRGAPTNVIIKKERRRYPGLVQNEIACLQIMSAAGVPAAPGAPIIGISGLFESFRYDRKQTGRSIVRLHQEDFCQATGRMAKQKYASGGGPEYSEIVSVLRRVSAEPIIDIELLARWAVANTCIGNNDAHAKNLSLLYTESEVRLAPAYDVVCTTAYPALADTFALTLGGAKSYRSLNAGSLRKAARSFGFTPRFMTQLVEEVATSILEAVTSICDKVAKSYGHVAALDHVEDVAKQRAPGLMTLSRGSPPSDDGE